MIKFGHNARCHWLKEHALSEYEAGIKSSRHCTMSDPYPDFSLAFFRLLKVKFGTGEPTEWAETKSFKRKRNGSSDF